MKSKPLNYLLFVGPALLFYSLFILIPAISGIGYSVTDWNGLNPKFNFIGLKNYLDLLSDKYFIKSFVFTTRYSVTILILQNLLAFGLALLIESLTKAKGFYRTLFFLPNVLSLVISAFIWGFIFNKVFPEIAQIEFFSFLDKSWLGDPKISFFSVISVSLWHDTGYYMIIYIAALQSVPRELLEAAMIDGASYFNRLKNIVLPMIVHGFTICIFLTLSSSFKVFDQVYALTSGGPGRATETVTLNLYEEAFSSSFRYGYANAKAIVLFLVLLIITTIQTSIMKKKEVQL